jgi:ankyrin repeat protein
MREEDRGAERGKTKRGDVRIPRTLFECASRRSCRKSLDVLLETNGIDARDEFGATALHWAARAGNRAMVRVLLSRGADVGARDDMGATALHMAAESGSPDTIVELARRGADPRAEDFLGRTPADLASRESAEKALRRILSGRAVKANDSPEFVAFSIAG